MNDHEGVSCGCASVKWISSFKDISLVLAHDLIYESR